ncbi:Hypothetical protein ORPV_754 [Orpheovirus IHUMI-LCC2]|uniref:MORN-repeat protein n=1 Tax=Orpheovirus IHUMI-LCC2 TaxID=2023057 RepID=A0A2I2L538_9VIRU|nr:Hypothetical protein ORPV_754 [Orpheovirus IHUMI-LCC2]SNW62658.1 Hypothetical protein ORPV_754 [Orpheovirus IHUMI-LCC2]
MSLLDLPDDIIIYHIFYENLDIYLSLYRLCKGMNILANKLGKDHYVEEHIENSVDKIISIYFTNKKTKNKVGKRVEIINKKYKINSVTNKLENILIRNNSYIAKPDIPFLFCKQNMDPCNNVKEEIYKTVDIKIVEEEWDKGRYGMKYITHYDNVGSIRREHIIKDRCTRIYKEYDELGNILEKITYNDKDEIHGRKYDTYEYDGDKITLEEYYNNGLLHGTHKILNHNKNILIEDKFYIKGLLNGNIIEFDDIEWILLHDNMNYNGVNYMMDIIGDEEYFNNIIKKIN